MSDKELIEKIEDAYRRVRKIGPDAIYETELREVLRAAADALEAATRERDAAVAAIERVRAIHYPFTPRFCYMNAQGGQSPMTSVHCHHCKPEGSNMVGDPDTWPCPTVAALDGAPEPEGRWEYRGRLQSCGYVAEGYISAEHAMNGLRVELEDHPYLAMDDTAIVERARVREWLPVEGDSKP